MLGLGKYFPKPPSLGSRPSAHRKQKACSPRRGDPQRTVADSLMACPWWHAMRPSATVRPHCGYASIWGSGRVTIAPYTRSDVTWELAKCCKFPGQTGRIRRTASDVLKTSLAVFRYSQTLFEGIRTRFVSSIRIFQRKFVSNLALR